MTEEKTEIGLDEISDYEMTDEMTVIFDDALTLIDKEMANLKPSERFVLGIRLATTITAATLGNGLKDQQHLLPQAVEALQDDLIDAAEQIFAAYDKDGRN